MKTDRQLKDLWIKFFTEHGFKRIPGYSIIPENDPTVLFTTAGMHPLVPYLLGESHPYGNRIFDIQRCLRTVDIDSVGDDSHLTLFEMLGNWTLGECNKKEMIALSYEFLTSPEYLNIPVSKLAVTVFEGDETAPKDMEAYNAWKECGLNENQIYFLPKENNWWSLGGGVGPCGPDSEMFYDTGKPKCSENCSPACDCGKYLEIWNDVFMQFHVKNQGEKAVLLDRPNIDTGMGLERTIAVLNGAKSVYDSGCLKRVIDFINDKAQIKYEDSPKSKKAYRIITDHLRSSVFILGDERGVVPSNVGQGYILRRFIRRSINCARTIKFDCKYFNNIVDLYVDEYGQDYEDIKSKRDFIKEELKKEVEKFSKALEEGHKEFEKVIAGIERHKEFVISEVRKIIQQYAENKEEALEKFEKILIGLDKKKEIIKEKIKQELEDAIIHPEMLLSDLHFDNKLSGKTVFRLYDTFGFPFELTKELALERGYLVDEDDFKEKFKEHQEKSRVASAGTFKGGLADDSKQSARLHTATHLLLAGLQHKYGKQVKQHGSNITPERLRFDFNLDHKMTKDELDEIEKFVNDAIEKAIPVQCEVMSVEKAKESGAEGIFTNKYGEEVKVYTIGNISKEICGGPHAENTSELHHFKILKEESSSSGIRRIKAILE